jgi:hypothetical protein
MTSKIIFSVLPLPFVLVNYRPLFELYAYTYALKHTLFLLFCALLILELWKERYEKTLVEKQVLISHISLVSYLFLNMLLMSTVSLTMLMYLISLLLFLPTVYLAGMKLDGWGGFKAQYYLLIILVPSLSIYSILTGENLFGTYSDLQGGVKVRWMFGFMHPGYFSSYFLIIYLLGTYLLIEKKIGKWNYVLLSLAVIVMFFSYTRNTILSVVLVTIWIYNPRSRFILRWGFVASLVVMSVCLLYDYKWLNAISSGRIGVWMSNFNHNLPNFSYLFGTGLGNAERLHYTESIHGEEVGDIFHVDNFFLDIFFQFGMVGLALLGWVLYSIYNMKGVRDVRNVGPFLLIIIFSMFDSSLFSTGNLLSIVTWTVFFYLNSQRQEVEVSC